MFLTFQYLRIIKQRRIIATSLKKPKGDEVEKYKGDEVEKNKGGRPRKEKKGDNVFVPAEIIDMVKAMVEVFRKQQPNQQANRQ